MIKPLQKRMLCFIGMNRQRPVLQADMLQDLDRMTSDPVAAAKVLQQYGGALPHFSSMQAFISSITLINVCMHACVHIDLILPCCSLCCSCMLHA